jgi:hypothetical protein
MCDRTFDSEDDDFFTVCDDPPIDDDLLLRFLRLHTRIFEILPGRTDIGSSFSTLLKGAVQSGKSRIIFGLCLLHSIMDASNVFVMVRNFTDDYDQFRRNFLAFLGEYEAFLLSEGLDHDDIADRMPSFYYIGSIMKDKQGRDVEMCEDMIRGRCVMIALANDRQLGVFNNYYETLFNTMDNTVDLVVIVDEADQLVYSDGIHFTPQFEYLFEFTTHLYGISATIYEAFYDPKGYFSTDRVFYLTPPIDYKGLSSLVYESISKTKKGLSDDEDLARFFENEKNRQPFHIADGVRHPRIALIKTESLISEQDKLMSGVVSRYKKEFTVITYNGTACRIYSPELIGVRMILPICRKKQATSSTDRVHVFNNCALPYVLQYLKDNGGADRFPRILILSYKLVGRGINIVSADFDWHLTHMFYRPSKGTSVTAMIQSIRLCGVYKDNIPLTCIMEKEMYDEMYKGYMLQEDIFQRVKSTKTDKSLTEWMRSQMFLKDKVPNGTLYKTCRFRGRITDKKEEDEGMSLDEFNQGRCITKTMIIPAMIQIKTGFNLKEHERLTNDKNGMFKKWADITNRSVIARFMREGLEPRREYTKKEITALWETFAPNTGIKSLMKFCSGKSRSYGEIITQRNNRYFLIETLRDAFDRYF